MILLLFLPIFILLLLVAFMVNNNLYFRSVISIIILWLITSLVLSQYEIFNRFEPQISEKLIVSVWKTVYSNKKWQTNIMWYYSVDLNTGVFSKYDQSFYSGSLISKIENVKNFNPFGNYYLLNGQIFKKEWTPIKIYNYPNYKEYRYWSQNWKYIISVGNWYKKYFWMTQEFWTKTICITELISGKTKQILPFQWDQRMNILDIIWVVK